MVLTMALMSEAFGGGLPASCALRRASSAIAWRWLTEGIRNVAKSPNPVASNHDSAYKLNVSATNHSHVLAMIAPLIKRRMSDHTVLVSDFKMPPWQTRWTLAANGARVSVAPFKALQVRGCGTRSRARPHTSGCSAQRASACRTGPSTTTSVMTSPRSNG